MKLLLMALVMVSTLGFARAENKTIQTPMTMEQLMRELRIQGGNFVFEFDEPTYARVTVSVSRDDPDKSTLHHYDTASANKRIELYFVAENMFVGDYSRGDREDNLRKMLIKLSDCKETEGTRIVGYNEKYVSNRYAGGGAVGMYQPDVPTVPVLDKDYILHWYYKEGEPYEAKATIRFSAAPFAK